MQMCVLKDVFAIVILLSVSILLSTVVFKYSLMVIRRPVLLRQNTPHGIGAPAENRHKRRDNDFVFNIVLTWR
jgi:hypothetical protein